MLTGYRVFSRRFVKSFPSLREGFGIETELTVHAVRADDADGRDGHALQGAPRGLGQSKLNTWRDGFAHPGHHPAALPAAAAAVFFSLIAGGVAGGRDHPRHAGVHHFHRDRPGAAPAHRGPGDRADAARLLSLTCGLILDNVTRGRQEMKRLLRISASRVSGATS